MIEREHFVATQDGLRVFVREQGPERELGLPVLCIHGLTRNSKDFEDILPRIAAGGRRALAIDVRGRGRSDRDPQPERYLPATYAGDVLAALDALGVAKAAFVGTSMGGLITMVVAGRAPERIERVVLNDIGPDIDPRGLARIMGYVGKSGAVASWEEAADRVESINRVAFPDAPKAFFMRMAKKQFRALDEGGLAPDYDPAITTPLANPSNAAPIDPWSLWRALAPIPTLVVRGAISDLLSREIVEKMRAVKPDMEFVEAASVGHAPMLDEPDVWPAVSRFLGLAA